MLLDQDALSERVLFVAARQCSRSLRPTLLRDCRARVRLPTYRSTTVHGDILVVTLIVITNYTVRFAYILLGARCAYVSFSLVHSHTLCGLRYYSLSFCCDCVSLCVCVCVYTTGQKFAIVYRFVGHDYSSLVKDDFHQRF